MKKLPIIILIALLQPVSIYCQTILIKGNVIDYEESFPLAGLIILEKNTNNGTAADADGNFQLEINAKNDGLRFMYVGRYELHIINIPETINELKLCNLKLVRDYSKYLHVEGAKDIKPDIDRHKKMEIEILENYRLNIDEKVYLPVIEEDKIIIDLKTK